MKAAHFLTGALGLALAAGSPHQDDKPGDEARDTPATGLAGVMVDSVNYLHDRGMKYTLFDISGQEKTTVGGSIVDPLGGGGAKECCINLPQVWHPGIKLRVEWQDSDYERTYPEIHARDLELPRYAHPADVYVVFYPDHEVEVVVSPAEPGHPEWAGRIKQTPWDRCVEEQGRKVCKRAIPYAGLSLEEMQGYCTYVEEEHRDPKFCTDSYAECMEHYEDEDLCKKTLWGARKP